MDRESEGLAARRDLESLDPEYLLLAARLVDARGPQLRDSQDPAPVVRFVEVQIVGEQSIAEEGSELALRLIGSVVLDRDLLRIQGDVRESGDAREIGIRRVVAHLLDDRLLHAVDVEGVDDVEVLQIPAVRVEYLGVPEIAGIDGLVVGELRTRELEGGQRRRRLRGRSGYRHGIFGVVELLHVEDLLDRLTRHEGGQARHGGPVAVLLGKNHFFDEVVEVCCFRPQFHLDLPGGRALAPGLDELDVRQRVLLVRFGAEDDIAVRSDSAALGGVIPLDEEGGERAGDSSVLDARDRLHREFLLDVDDFDGLSLAFDVARVFRVVEVGDGGA